MVPRSRASRGKAGSGSTRRARPRPATGRLAVPISAEPLCEVPGLIRRARAKVADAPEALRHLADMLEGAIHEFSTDAGPDRLESASVQILTSAAAAGAIIVNLVAFAGGLAELARVVSTGEAP